MFRARWLVAGLFASMAACGIEVTGTMGEPAPDASVPDSQPPPVTDAGGDDADGGAASLCRGLVLVLPFDGTLDGDRGEKPMTAVATPFEPAGQFGGAVTLDAERVEYAPTGYSRRSGTLSVWVRVTQAAKNDCDLRLFSTPIPGDTPGHRLMLRTDNSVCRFRFAANVGSSSDVYTGDPKDSFQHLVGRWSLGNRGTTVSLRVDGVGPSDTQNIGTPTLAVTSITLNEDRKMAGSALDDLGLWNRSLSTAEVEQLEAAARAGTALSALCPVAER